MRVGATIVSLACLGAATALAYLWLEPETGEPRDLRWQRPAAIKPELPAATVKPETLLPAADPSAYTAMLERPLFAPDRRPPPPPKVVVEPPPDPLNNLQLLGVFEGEAAGVIASVDGRSRRIRVNDRVGEWTLSAVAQRDAIFTRGEEKRTIQLAYAKWGSAPRPVAAARPAAPGVLTAQTPEAERARIQQEQEAERWRIVNEIRARAGMLKP